MKTLGIVFLFMCCQGLAARNIIIYEPCEKTYIDPLLVKLNGNKIEVDHKGAPARTSTLFSDNGGLYYIDILVETLGKERQTTDLATLFNEGFFSHESDMLVEPFASHSENALVTSNPLNESQYPSVEQRHQPNQNSQKLVWPYCDKQR